MTIIHHTGYLIAKSDKLFCSGEVIDLYFCWYFGSYILIREGHVCLIHQFNFFYVAGPLQDDIKKSKLFFGKNNLNVPNVKIPSKNISTIFCVFECFILFSTFNLK